MKLSRRDFLKISGLATLGMALGRFPFKLTSLVSYVKPLRIKYARETTSICCYCGVGCGLIVHSRAGKVINIEGDPDHPINQGSLCSKGSALFQVANNDRRLSKILYRAPFSAEWKEVDWDWALDNIARKIKDTRDANFITTNKDGKTVNRLEAIACLGGAALDNEECYLYSKFARSLGIVYLEHQARI